MQIRIQSIHFPTSVALNEMIEKKIKRSFENFPYIQKADIFLRLEGEGPSATKLIEVDVPVPQRALFAKCQAETFEKAIDQVIPKLKRQLEKYRAVKERH